MNHVFIRVEDETGNLVTFVKETNPYDTFKGIVKMAFGHGLMQMAELFNALSERDDDDDEGQTEIPLGALTLSYMHMRDLGDEEGIPLAPHKNLVEKINEICEELNTNTRNLMLQVTPMIGTDHLTLTIRAVEPEQQPLDEPVD